MTQRKTLTITLSVSADAQEAADASHALCEAMKDAQQHIKQLQLRLNQRFKSTQLEQFNRGCCGE